MSHYHDAVAGGGVPKTQNADRRWAHRKSCQYRAMITRPGSGVRASCMIVNMSTTGACLELCDLAPGADESMHLPAYFTLTIRADRMEIDCAVVWRKGVRLGVRFLAAPRAMTPVQSKNL